MSDDKPKDGLMTLLDSDETKKEIADTKAAVDKLKADEKALEADPKVRLKLALSKMAVVVDEIDPLLALLPEPERTIAADVKAAIDFAAAELAKL